MIALARSLRVPLVATNGVCYATPAEREVLDVFTCLHHKTTLEGAGQLLSQNAERYLKSALEMARLFADVPEAVANTQGISSRLNFTFSDLGYEFPDYPVPPGERITSFLRKRTEEGARCRFRPYHQRTQEQIDRELAILKS